MWPTQHRKDANVFSKQILHARFVSDGNHANEEHNDGCIRASIHECVGMLYSGQGPGEDHPGESSILRAALAATTLGLIQAAIAVA